jgi:hypothetical protein
MCIVMLSKRSLAFWFLGGSILAGGLGWWLSLADEFSGGLAYQGKPIEYWFNQLPMVKVQIVQGKETACMGDKMRKGHTKSGAVRKYGSWVETPEASAQAIRAMGTNGIAFYFRRLKRQDLPIRKRIQQAAFAVGVRHFLFEDVDAERGQAVTALLLLKPLPPSAASELVALSKNSNGAIAAAARVALTVPADTYLHSNSGIEDAVDRDRGRFQERGSSPSNFVRELDKSHATSDLAGREVTNREFQPSTLVLDGRSLWDAAKVNRKQTSLDTNKGSLSTKRMSLP